MPVPSRMLDDCRLCPRHCGVNRQSGSLGYCGIDDRIPIASICIHRGEEPVISGERGICNVFFSHCNLQCRFCQNSQISDNHRPPEYWSIHRTVLRIEHLLGQGIDNLGFVSPSHVIPQMVRIIEALQHRGHVPTVVYNSSGYDCAETLKEIEGLVDVYLPDLKYADHQLAEKASGAPDYPETARSALKEMFRQMNGPRLELDSSGLARHGMIIRHLVLPGYPENSIACLDWIAQELSRDIHISLMSQYHPTKAVLNTPPFDRPVSEEEYNRVCLHLEELGFENGWIQELESSRHYQPDFDRDHPFEP